MKYRRFNEKQLLKRIVALFLVFTIILGSPHMQRIFGGVISGGGEEDRIEIFSATASDTDEGEIDLREDSINLSQEKEEGNFKYRIRDNKIIITGLSDAFTGNDISIPNMIDGKDVVEIGERAFYIKNIDSLTLGSNIEKIGAYAFTGNNITEVNFPDSLKEIGEYAFRDNNLSALSLNHITKVGEGSFLNNILSSLNLGDSLEEISSYAFKNNNIKEVNIPDSLNSVGDEIFSDNKRFVKLIGDNINENIPRIQKNASSYGYVINPIKLKISFIDKDTTAQLLDSINVGDDLSALNNIFVKGQEQEYRPPELPNYRLYTEDGSKIESIRFTPDTDPYELKVYYTKKSENISLKLKAGKLPMLAVDTPNVKEALLDLVSATNERGADLSSEVEIAPEDIDVSTEGAVRDVLYTLHDEDTQETRYLNLKVYIGTDMNKFPLGNDWRLGDFTYNNYEVTGYSQAGRTKSQTNKNLVLPHINPFTGETITAVGVEAFTSNNLLSVEAYQDTISTLGAKAFYSQANLAKVDLHNLINIGESAFHYSRLLEDFDFANVVSIGKSAFESGGIKKVVAPQLIQLGKEAFGYSKVGTDTDFPDGIYLPKITEISESAFHNTFLSYIDREKQFPNVSNIGKHAFSGLNSFQNKTISVRIPKLSSVGEGAFSGSGVKELEAPDLLTVSKYAFMSNQLEKLSLPKLTDIDEGGFSSNRIVSLDLPEVQNLGKFSFARNQITTANLPKLQTIGTYAFLGERREHYRVYTTDERPEMNPGLATFKYFIPIYTENTNLENRENYIINPVQPTSQIYDEDDFIWDEDEDTKVLGFSNKGKAKYIANNLELTLPDKVTAIGDYAFSNMRIRKVVAPNVKVVGIEAFKENEFEEIIMPKLEEAKDSAFRDNFAASDKKIKNIDLPKLIKVGELSFNWLGLESISLPLLEETGKNSFSENRIVELDAPRLKVAGYSSFYHNRIKKINVPELLRVDFAAFLGNSLEEITSKNFPKLEHIGQEAFEDNPVTRLDLPKLKYSEGDREFKFNGAIPFYASVSDKPLVWIMPEGVKNRLNSSSEYWIRNGSTSYAKNTFRQLLGGTIIITEPPNPDGTLKRINAYKNLEEREYFSIYDYFTGSHSLYGRSVIINPGTVKVHYKLEDGNSLDGRDGRPKLDDTREYIYEEQSIDYKTYTLKPTRLFTAPDVEGYTVLSATDTLGNTVMGRGYVEVPFEAFGHRTDRDITFTYTKIDKNLTSGPKLKYGIGNIDTGNIEKQEASYSPTGEISSYRTPQMFTVFNIDEVNKPIVDGRIKVEFDNPYIDITDLNINTSVKTDEWYANKAWAISDEGIEITLKNNIASGTKLNSSITYKFKKTTPHGAVVNMKMSLISKNDAGVYEVIAESENVRLTFNNPPKVVPSIPRIEVRYSRKNSASSLSSDADNGPRDLGELRDTDKGKAVVLEPEVREFYYVISGITEAMSSVSLITVLPEYTYIDENGEEKKKTLDFDENLNPEWKLSEDGKRVIYTKKFITPISNSDYMNTLLPKLKFRFKGAKENEPIVNKTYAILTKNKDIRDLNSYANIRAIGDMGDGDSLTIYPLHKEIIRLEDISVSKRSNGTPRRGFASDYFYDTLEDRSKNIEFNLDIATTNEVVDYKNVSIIDYGLDSRLKYASLKFNNEVDKANLDVDIVAFSKVGANINPIGDRIVFEKQVKVDKNKEVIFGDFSDIDYIQIKLLGTDVKPLKNNLSFTIVTKLKNVNSPLFDATNSANNIFENKAMFIGDEYVKNTSVAAKTKPENAKYENINANSIREASASVEVKEYKLHLGVEKRLVYGDWPKYPPLDTNEVVLEGSEGSYHIFLNSRVEDSTDRGNNKIRNLEVIDVLPEAIEFEKQDIELDPLFIKTGGKVEILSDYNTIENGQSVKRTALKFTASNFDMASYGGKDMRIASIKTKYTGATIKSILTNKVYAKWDNEDVIVDNPAKNSLGNLIDAGGRELTGNGKAYAYNDVGIRVFRSSALLGQLYIKNHSGDIWQTNVPTRSEEKFDYKVLISNFENEDSSSSYSGLDIINVLPEPDDTRLNKEGSRGTNLEGVKFDTTRTVTVPSGYTVTYLNTDRRVSELLAGNNTLETILKDTSLTWESNPAANTKMVRITANNGTSLTQGESFEALIPMVSPVLTNNLGKKAVDSFAFRLYKKGTTEYTKFVESNIVSNYMEVPEGSISFTKYGKEGRSVPDSEATPLAGATFKLYDLSKPDQVLQMVTSDNLGKVKFEHILTNKTYIVEEVASPESYAKSDSRLYVSEYDFAVAKANNYAVEKDAKTTFMNVKKVSGSIKITKKAGDGHTPLSDVSFKIKRVSAADSVYENIFTTNENGIIFVDNLEEGYYSIEELESAAVARYQAVPVSSFNIYPGHTVYEREVINDKFQMAFRKIVVEDEELLNPSTWDTLTDFQKKLLSGYKFKISAAGEPDKITDATDRTGTVIVQNLKTNVDYTITELPPQSQVNPNKDLYTYNPREYKFRITTKGELINVANGKKFVQYTLNMPSMAKKVKGKIVVKKVDKTDTSTTLAGAKMALYSLAVSDSGEVSYTKLEEKITDENGLAVFENLAPGNYRIREIEPPLGYLLTNLPVDFSIPSQAPETGAGEYDRSGDDIVYTLNKIIPNAKAIVKGIKGSDIRGRKNIPISAAEAYINAKKNANPNLHYRIIGSSFATVYETVAGAKFELYETNNGIKQGSAIAINGNTTITSAADGSIGFGDYRFDYNKEYSIYEIAPADGYELNIGYKTFKLSEEAAKAGFNGTYSFYIDNTASQGEISISKYDSIEKKSLAGVKFNLYKLNNGNVDFTKPFKSVTTGADGIAYFSRLSFADYIVREEEAPSEYKQPIAGQNDINIKLRETKTADDDGPIVKKKIFNTKLIDINIRKEWEKGSEAGIKVKLLKSTNKSNLDSGEVVKVDGLTDENGLITLNRDNNWTVKYPKLDMADERGNIFYFKPVEVEVKSGEAVDASYTNRIVPLDSSNLSYSEAGYNFVITNISKNTASIKVKKEWIVNGTNTAPSGASVNVALKKIGVGSTILTENNIIGEPVSLDATSNESKIAWYHSFDDLPLREWGEDVKYDAVEVTTPEGFKPATYERTKVGNNTNIVITNEAITRDITINKTWEGVSGTKPRVSISLYNKADMSTPLVPAVEVENNIARFTDVPSYTYTVENGEIKAKAIEYAVKEKYYDDNHPTGYENPIGYETDINFDMEYEAYKLPQNSSKNLDIAIVNKLKTTNISISKAWENVSTELAPSVNLKLVDYTADTTINHSDTTKHIDVRNLTLNNAGGFSSTIENLPRYKSDGLTAIKYGIVELGDKPGYELKIANTVVENGSLVTSSSTDETGMNFNLTNTRKLVKANLSKTWEMAEGFYEAASVEKPRVNLHLWAVVNDDLEHKTPAKNIIASNEEELGTIVLDRTNSYRKAIENLPKYTADGENLIDYYVTEDDITGFETLSAPIKLELNDEGNLSTVINNVQEKLDINVEKHWVGLDKYDDLTNIPALHVNLYDNTSGTKKLLKGNVALVKDTADASIWKAGFRDMPKYYLDGTEIVYTVEESENLTGYKTEVSDDGFVDNGRKFTITNTVKKQNIEVNKIWELKKEDTIEVELLRDENVIKTETISADENASYKHTFENLPIYAIDGTTQYEYSIKEKAIKGYDVPKIVKAESVDDSKLIFNITNTYKTVDVNVSKSWVGVSENEAPSINLQLVDITDADNPINLGANYTMTLNRGKWSDSFKNVPMYKEVDGELIAIKYSVIESSALDGYKFSIENSTFAARVPKEGDTNKTYGTWTINTTNERIKTDIEVDKIWTADTSGYTRPAVSLTLLKDETNGVNPPVEVSTTEVSAATDWKLKEKLPKYTVDGRNLIKYFVREEAVSGYNTQTGNIPLAAEEVDGKEVLKASVTNSLKTVNIKVNKTFEGLDKYANTDDLPELHIQLKDVTDVNNKKNIGTAKLLTKIGQKWQVSFENLPMYDSTGNNLIKYDIEEVEDKNLPGYTAVKENPNPELVNGSYTFNLVNKVETVDIKLKKSWKELKNGNIVDIVGQKPSIELKLVDNTNRSNTSTLVSTITRVLSFISTFGNTTASDIDLADKKINLNEANNYEGKILSLPKYHIDGITPVNYGVEEIGDLDGYEFTFTKSDLSDDGKTISISATNTRKNIKLNLEKIWEADNIGYERPEVTFKIYTSMDADAAAIKELKLNSSTNFKATVDLPKYELNGTELINYYVEEVVPKGYKSNTSRVAFTANNNELNASITNRLELRDVEIVKEWTGLESYKSTSVSKIPNIHVELYDITNGAEKAKKVGQTKELVKGADGKYRATYENLAKYTSDGNTEIKYMVKEVEAATLNGYSFSSKTPQVTQNDKLVLGIQNTVEKQEIKVKKTWNGVEPENAPEVRLKLVANNGTNLDLSDKEIVLNKNNNFKGSFGELPKYDIDGRTLIDYKLEEVATKRGYTFTQAKNEGIEVELEAINTRVPISVTLSKNWIQNGTDYPKPNVHFKLYAGNNIDTAVPVIKLANGENIGDIELSEASNWTKVVNNLPKYDESGENLLKYYVEEEPIAGYTSNGRQELLVSSISNEMLQAGIENTLVPTSVVVEQTFEGLENYTDDSLTSLPSIDVDLYDMTDGSHPIKLNMPRTLRLESSTVSTSGVIATQSLPRTAKWVTKYENLPKYKEDGTTEIVYGIGDISSFAGYTQSPITRGASPNGDTLLSFVETAITTKLRVKKTWLGVDENKAPNIEIRLIDKTDNITQSDISNIGETINLNKDMNWQYEYTLPKYHIDGTTPVEYDCKEQGNRLGYTFSKGENSISDDGITINLLNTRLLIPNTRIEKIWDNTSDEYTRPNVRLALYKKEASTYTKVRLIKEGLGYKADLNGSSEAIEDFNISEVNNWSIDIKDLPKYDETGENLLEYYIKEEAMSGYVTPTDYIKPESMEDGNLYAKLENKIEKRTIKVEKQWEGIENYSKEELKNLAKVHAVLYDITNGKKEVERKEFIKDTEGTYKAIFEDIPKYKSDGSTEISYAIEELEAGTLEGFDTKVEKIDEQTYLITNSLKTGDISVTKTWRTPPFLVDKVEVYLTKGGIKIGEPVVLTEANSWTYHFKNVPEYEPDGVTRIKYSVKEVEVFAYQSHVKDINGDNKNFEVYNIYTGIVKDGRNGSSSVANRFVSTKLEKKPDTGNEEVVYENPITVDTPTKIKNKILSLVPRTGDTSDILRYLGMLALAGIVVVILVLLKKKENK